MERDKIAEYMRVPLRAMAGIVLAANCLCEAALSIPGNGAKRFSASVVWTGATRSGGKAGTGAYILQTEFTTHPDSRTGSPFTQSRVRRIFGFLRGSQG